MGSHVKGQVSLLSLLLCHFCGYFRLIPIMYNDLTRPIYPGPLDTPSLFLKQLGYNFMFYVSQPLRLLLPSSQKTPKLRNFIDFRVIDSSPLLRMSNVNKNKNNKSKVLEYARRFYKFLRTG